MQRRLGRGTILPLSGSMALRRRLIKTNARKKSESTLPDRPRKRKQPADEKSEVYLDLKKDKRYDFILQKIKREFHHKKNASVPVGAKPTLASITAEPFNDKDWQFEIKWDGYRSLAYLNDGTAKLFSRNNLPFNHKYPSLVQQLEQWPVNAVVDGEIVVLGEDGRAVIRYKPF